MSNSNNVSPSNQTFAALRRNYGTDLGNLAEEHFKHDLNQDDRDALAAAGKQVSTYSMVGSAVGVSLGLLLAFRVRRNRVRAFNAIKVQERPTSVQFKDGRTEPLPDLIPMLRPSTLGDVAAYTFFGAGGLFLGGETGLLAGTWRARSTISRDDAMKQRIETAFRRFRADVLRREAEVMETGGSSGLGI
ncbi:MAG: hypothetical protein M1828_002541 [Chrysothrix sp. TS-e1954]|nr:MAG: hypothetical protein M1828_002541 [Chrysothrix sp. TS-e1954]